MTHDVKRARGGFGLWLLAAWLGCGAEGSGSGGGGGALICDTGGQGGSGGVAAGAGGSAGAGSCLDDHAVGERFSVGETCNFCDCEEDGTSTCTDRTCTDLGGQCTYGGARHSYGERFPARDCCNECACTFSGIACTRRDCGPPEGLEEGPREKEDDILVESLDAPCGDDPTFTASAALGRLPSYDFVVPFHYEPHGEDLPEDERPETLPDSQVRVRIVYGGGIVVCRPPNPDYEHDVAELEFEIVVEWMTEDGAFNEGAHGYMRAYPESEEPEWSILAYREGLQGSFEAGCSDSFFFDLRGDATAAEGDITNGCGDYGLILASFAYP